MYQIASNISEPYTFENRQGGSLIIVLAGRAVSKVDNFDELRLSRGSVIFAPATSKRISLKVENDDVKEAFVAYQAMYNDFL